MPAATAMKPSTPLSTVSSVGTNSTTNTATAIQSGPYTKAQFQNTVEGSRSVKAAKEVEQLLRDYPAALELYRTGRYKVKVKYEADVERVILVEKRSSKNGSNNTTKTNDFQQNNQSISDISADLNKPKEQSRSRTHSRDHVAPTSTSVTNNDASVPTTTTSSMHMTSNTQPKVDHNRTQSKDREGSVTSQSKQQQQQPPPTYRRSRPPDSPSNGSHSKQKGRKNSRDYPRALVPYVPNANSNRNMWDQSRAIQPYYSNPILPQYSPQPNMYMPLTYVPQQNAVYQQPYYYAQPPPPAFVYQNQSGYPGLSALKTTGTIAKPPLPPSHNYQSASWPVYNSNNGANVAPSYQSFYPQQQQYAPQPAMYQPLIPFQMPAPWPTAVHRPVGPVVYNNNNNGHVESRRGSKHRAHSVDTGPHSHPPVGYYNQQQQQQPAATITEHHHRHHHHRSYPTNIQVNGTGPSEETAKEQNKETTTAANNSTNAEKLTIRQLNEIFVQTDPSGRLPYGSLPNILQRFGISLTENDLTSAAQDLDYSVTDPLSARRAVHVLIKLGKIAKSTSPQKQPQRTLASPTMLPEDREVTAIMTQRRAGAAPSTHIHSSTNPNYWY